MDVRHEFLTGLASHAGFDQALLERPGTVVVSSEDRAGSGAAIWYEAGAHTLLWCDPAREEALAPFTDDARSVDLPTFSKAMTDQGLELVAAADMRVLVREAIPLAPLPSEYLQRWLRADRPSDVDLVRAFADRSTADDLEEAALDDLDNYEERAINVFVPASGEADHIVAYASAADWDWDARFADIGVLVDPKHRQRGLGTLVVGHTIAALQTEDRLPLYRHDQANAGSRKIADAIGFERVTSLAYFAAPG